MLVLLVETTKQKLLYVCINYRPDVVVRVATITTLRRRIITYAAHPRVGVDNRGRARDAKRGGMALPTPPPPHSHDRTPSSSSSSRTRSAAEKQTKQPRRDALVAIPYRRRACRELVGEKMERKIEASWRDWGTGIQSSRRRRDRSAIMVPAAGKTLGGPRSNAIRWHGFSCQLCA